MPVNRILAVFVRRALRNEPLVLAGLGMRRQNYIDVRDVGQAVDLCITRNVSGLFNIASLQACSNRELAETCVRTMSSASPILFSGEPDAEEDVVWDVSIAKAADCFGYHPQFTIEDSILAVASDYRRRPDP
jgi:nucleoside-diphosphate-sugar epimerase